MENENDKNLVQSAPTSYQKGEGGYDQESAR